MNQCKKFMLYSQETKYYLLLMLICWTNFIHFVILRFILFGMLALLQVIE